MNDPVELAQAEAEGRTVVVAVGRVHAPALIDYGIKLATAQSKAAGIPYRQLVVFHMSDAVTDEQVLAVERGAARSSSSSLPADALPIFIALSELAPPDMRSYLAIVPVLGSSVSSDLAAAVAALVEFQDRHGFTGHMVLVGTQGRAGEGLGSLGERLEGCTLIPVPLSELPAGPSA